MGSNKVCLIGLDNHTVHFDRAQMDQVCSGWSTLIERAGHRSVRVCLKWPTLTEQTGHRSVRACSRCPVLFRGGGSFARGNKTTTQRTLTEEAGHRSDRAWSRWLTLTEQVGHRSVCACSRWPCLFQATKLGLCRLAINFVVRPAIWGESRVSMMNPTPDPPYKISRNFKLQSCGPNLSCGAIMFVRLD